MTTRTINRSLMKNHITASLAKENGRYIVIDYRRVGIHATHIRNLQAGDLVWWINRIQSIIR